MARDAELRAKITATDDASKVIGKVADAAKDLEKPIDVKVDAEVSAALSALDQVTAEAKATAEAAEVLGRALGPDLAAKADTTAIVGDLKNMGLTLDQIKGNADELGAKMREMSDADVGGKLGSSLGTTRGQMDELGKSADSSKSVLANMVGNSVQDVGALGGVAGSAGVAIGQMGEYMADAAGAGDKMGDIFKNFGKVAGPLAGIAAATQLVSEAMAARAESAEVAAKQTTMLTDAYRKGGDAATNYAEALNEIGEVQVQLGRNKTADEVGGLMSAFSKLSPIVTIGAEKLGLFGEATADLAPMLAEAGVSTDNWAAAVVGGNQAFGDLATGLAHTTLSADEQKTVLDALTDAQTSNGEAKRNAAVMEGVFGKAVDDSTSSLDDSAAAADRTRQATERLDAQWQALTGTLSDESAFLSLQDAFDDVRQKGEESWAAAASGAADAEQKANDYQQSIVAAKEQVVTLGRQIGLSIPEVQNMLLRIDSGDIDRVERELKILERNRTMELSVTAHYGAGFGNNPGQVPAPRAVNPAPAGPTVTPFGATTAVAATATATSSAAATPVVVPVMFQLPTAADVARRIGPVRIPLFVQHNLLADRRINGNL